MGKWMSVAMVSLLGVACDPTSDEAETEVAPAPVEASTESPAAASPVAERLERALRAIDREEGVEEAKQALEAVVADKSATPEQRDEAKLGISRALSALGDDEGAIATVEQILGSDGYEGQGAVREAAEKRLRLLLTGKAEGTRYRLPRAKPLPPAAVALSKLFEADADGRILVDMYLFGTSGRERAEVWEVAEAKREEMALMLSKNTKIAQSVSQSSSWTSLPGAMAQREADMPQADKSLLVFFYDLEDGRVPARYDAYLPLPSAEIAATLEGGEGLIAVRKRETGKPTIVLAAPRPGQLALVEDAFAKLAELPETPVKVDLPNGLMPEEIQARVRASFGEVRACYEELLERNSTAEGKILIDFVIDAAGKVERASFGDDTTLKDAKMEDCVLRSVRKFDFPAVGKSTTVKYPVVMTP